MFQRIVPPNWNGDHWRLHYNLLNELSPVIRTKSNTIKIIGPTIAALKHVPSPPYDAGKRHRQGTACPEA
jgi:hypothetical protein